MVLTVTSAYTEKNILVPARMCIKCVSLILVLLNRMKANQQTPPIANVASATEKKALDEQNPNTKTVSSTVAQFQSRVSQYAGPISSATSSHKTISGRRI